MKKAFLYGFVSIAAVIFCATLYGLVNRMIGTEFDERGVVWTEAIVKDVRIDSVARGKKTSQSVRIQLESYDNCLIIDGDFWNTYSLARNRGVFYKIRSGMSVEIQLSPEDFAELTASSGTWRCLNLLGLRNRDETFFSVKDVNAEISSSAWWHILLFIVGLIFSGIFLLIGIVMLMGDKAAPLIERFLKKKPS